MAAGVMGFFFIGGPSFSFFALRPLGCSASDVAGIYLPPTLCAAAATSLGYFLSSVLPLDGQDLLKLIVLSLASLAAYIPLVRWLSPDATKDTVRKFSLVLHHAT